MVRVDAPLRDVLRKGESQGVPSCKGLVLGGAVR